jgi:hypothetical protein
MGQKGTTLRRDISHMSVPADANTTSINARILDLLAPLWGVAKKKPHHAGPARARRRRHAGETLAKSLF